MALKICLRKKGEGTLTDARHGVQSRWLWLLATEFIICSIHWSFCTRLQSEKKKKKKKVFQCVMLLSVEIYMLMRGKTSLRTDACEDTGAGKTTFWELRVSTDRQVVLVRVEEVVQVVYRHH